MSSTRSYGSNDITMQNPRETTRLLADTAKLAKETEEIGLDKSFTFYATLIGFNSSGHCRGVACTREYLE